MKRPTEVEDFYPITAQLSSCRTGAALYFPIFMRDEIQAKFNCIHVELTNQHALMSLGT